MYGTVPSPFLVSRIEEGLRLYREGYGEYIIVSGGQLSLIHISFVAEQLEDYLLSRDIYPKFTDFTPVLFERLQQEAGKTQPDTAKTYVVLLSIAGLGAGFVLDVYKRQPKGTEAEP